MSRGTAWVDRDQQEKENQRDIMQDKAGSVDVYRTRNGSASAGFSGEVKEPQFLKTIVARLDNSRTFPDRATDQDAKVQRPLIALCDDNDVLEGDIWRWHDLAGQPQWHRVLHTEAIQLGNTVILDELRREAWPKSLA